MMQAAWLPALMQASFSEIYIVDVGTHALLEANPSARRNLAYDAHALSRMTLSDLAPELSPDALRRRLAALREGADPDTPPFETRFVRKDGSAYPVAMRLRLCAEGGRETLVVVAHDLGERHASDTAPRLSDARVQAIVSQAPGMVYRFLLRDDGTLSFSYVSEGCHALLGLDPRRLCDDADLFLALILPEDRRSYLDSMQASAAGQRVWNWEGRIWIESWKDVKWINLRSTPSLLPGVGVQWEGIMSNITQSKLEEAEIKRSREQLAELSAHVHAVKEKERTRIAREIHDDIGGNLTAIKMALAVLARRLPPEDAALAEKTAYVDALVDRTIESTHRISLDLRPGILDFGIVAAIDWQASEFEKQLGIPCEFSSNRPEIDLPPDQATALFRIFQEALTNIAKHANALCVKVRLVAGKRSVRLEVQDNGRGIAAVDRLKSKSFGIRGMMERASALGGKLTVGGALDGGTLVQLSMPLPDGPA